MPIFSRVRLSFVSCISRSSSLRVLLRGILSQSRHVTIRCYYRGSNSFKIKCYTTELERNSNIKAIMLDEFWRVLATFHTGVENSTNQRSGKLPLKEYNDWFNCFIQDIRCINGGCFSPKRVNNNVVYYELIILIAITKPFNRECKVLLPYRGKFTSLICRDKEPTDTLIFERVKVNKFSLTCVDSSLVFCSICHSWPHVLGFSYIILQFNAVLPKFFAKDQELQGPLLVLGEGVVASKYALREWLVINNTEEIYW